MNEGRNCAMYTVEKCEYRDDWCFLSGCRCAIPEGTLSEWKAVAEAIRSGKVIIYFEWLACRNFEFAGGLTLWSPRCASNQEDYHFVTRCCIPGLLASIDAIDNTRFWKYVEKPG